MAFAIGSAISAVGSIAGGLISGNANSKAAKEQANAIREAANTQAAATRDAIAARNDALGAANQRMPAIEAARVGGANNLAAVQETQGGLLADATRDTGRGQGQLLDAAEVRAGEIESGAFDTAANTLTNAGDRGITALTDAGNRANWSVNFGADQGIGALTAAGNRGITALNAGQAEVSGLFRPVIDEAPDTYNPGYRLGLTPNQTIAREDLLRRARGVVAASGLRGAGRGGVATILDADRRFLAGAADTNDGLNRDAEKTNLTLRQNQRTRADAARSAIASSAMTTGQSISNLETQRGQGVASLESQRGQGLANIATQQGQSVANIESQRGQGIAGIRTAQGTAGAASARRRGEIGSNVLRNDLEAVRGNLAAGTTAAATRVAGGNAYADDLKWISGLGLNTGNQDAATISNNGDDQARALTGIGTVNANSTTANGALSADLIGRIGALGGDYLERYLKANPSGDTGNAGLVRDTNAGTGG